MCVLCALKSTALGKEWVCVASHTVCPRHARAELYFLQTWLLWLRKISMGLCCSLLQHKASVGVVVLWLFLCDQGMLNAKCCCTRLGGGPQAACAAPGCLVRTSRVTPRISKNGFELASIQHSGLSLPLCIPRCAPQERIEQRCRSHDFLLLSVYYHPRTFAYNNLPATKQAGDIKHM